MYGLRVRYHVGVRGSDFSRAGVCMWWRVRKPVRFVEDDVCTYGTRALACKRERER